MFAAIRALLIWVAYLFLFMTYLITADEGAQTFAEWFKKHVDINR